MTFILTREHGNRLGFAKSEAGLSTRFHVQPAALFEIHTVNAQQPCNFAAPGIFLPTLGQGLYTPSPCPPGLENTLLPATCTGFLQVTLAAAGAAAAATRVNCQTFVRAIAHTPQTLNPSPTKGRNLDSFPSFLPHPHISQPKRTHAKKEARAALSEQRWQNGRSHPCSHCSHSLPRSLQEVW